MEVLDVKAFLKLNENQKIYNVGHVTDKDVIFKTLKKLAEESGKTALNCEKSKTFDSLEPTHDKKADELTRELASLDITYEQFSDVNVQKLLSKILFNTLEAYYYGELDYHVYIENCGPDYCDNEPGEDVTWFTSYDFSEDFDQSLSHICGEMLCLRTYNFTISYDMDKGEPIAYVDWYTPDGEDISHDDFPDDFIPMKSDIDFYNEFEKIYDKHCEECKDDYDPNYF